MYLAGGASLVVVVDPSKRSAHVHDARGVRMLCEGDVLEHPALPGFALLLQALFAAAERPR